MRIEGAKAEGKRIEQEERRKTLQEQSKLDQQKSQYQDQLARKRLVRFKTLGEKGLIFFRVYCSTLGATKVWERAKGN